ncbi:MAG TPA: NAD(P)-binding domain-containing protein [Terriglobales bacterium]|nr:NAD(P)-binding domain-containing protein [Terriglobales bacterium]
MKYAIIGSGEIGTALARVFARKKIEVAITNSRGPATLASLTKELGPNVVVSSNDADASTIVAAVAEQLGFAPVELGRLDQGGAPLHFVGRQPGGLLFQNLEKLG